MTRYEQIRMGLVAGHNGSKNKYARFTLPIDEHESRENYASVEDLINSGEIDFECWADESRLAEVVGN